MPVRQAGGREAAAASGAEQCGPPRRGGVVNREGAAEPHTRGANLSPGAR